MITMKPAHRAPFLTVGLCEAACIRAIVAAAIALTSCAATSGERGERAEATSVRAFLREFDSAIRREDWSFIEAAVASAGRVVFIGPPPEQRRVVGKAEDLVSTLKHERRRPGYDRHRSIEALIVDSEGRTAIVVSIIETRYLDDGGDDVAVAFVEAVWLSLGEPRPHVTDYEARIVDFPRSLPLDP